MLVGVYTLFCGQLKLGYKKYRKYRKTYVVFKPSAAEALGSIVSR